MTRKDRKLYRQALKLADAIGAAADLSKPATKGGREDRICKLYLKALDRANRRLG